MKIQSICKAEELFDKILLAIKGYDNKILIQIILTKVNNNRMKKGTPKRDGSGKGTRANKGRGGCKTPRKQGK